MSRGNAKFNQGPKFTLCCSLTVCCLVARLPWQAGGARRSGVFPHASRSQEHCVPRHPGADVDRAGGGRLPEEPPRRGTLNGTMHCMHTSQHHVLHADISTPCTACTHLNTMRCMQTSQHHALHADISTPCTACRHLNTMRCMQISQHHALHADISTPCAACRHLNTMRCMQISQHHALHADISTPCAACRHLNTMRCMQTSQHHALHADISTPCAACTHLNTMRCMQTSQYTSHLWFVRYATRQLTEVPTIYVCTIYLR